MKSDDTLRSCRELADRNSLGYEWFDSLLGNVVVEDDGK